ncbi:MAG: carbonic anhydrase family protein [Rhodocyclaceae bacterium]|nr:carbonic anhydrase family protein [Rhodocyclaceae bacterium]
MRPSQQYKFSLALAAALGAGAASAASWEPVVVVKGERIELDTSRIVRQADGRAKAWSRLALERDFIDETGMRYTAIEALNRYDCEKHTFVTVKRVYRRDGQLVRTEKVATPREMAAEPGTPDDRLLAQVCKAHGADADGRAMASTEVQAAEIRDANARPTVMYADMRMADTAAPNKPIQVGDKPADAKAADKPAEKPADGKSGERPRYIELPKIDKSKLEDPAAPAKAADAKEPAKPAVAKAEKAAERPTDKVLSYRQELERQYASSGPRRAPKAKPAAAVAVVEHHDVHWSYDGEGAPANWSKLRPEFATCASGKRQSPIDIREGIKVDLEPIQFDYKLSRFSIIDNGHSIQVNVGEGSTMRIMERTFQLVQFHFHKPSEERINGRAYDMVVHFVHEDEAGRLAVVAVPLEKGSENPLIQAIWNNLPLDQDQEVAPSWVIDPNLLLPPPERRAYYTYMGSLTTPPCTEDVLWMVFKQPVQVSPQQIGIFSRLYNNNARPVQPSNGRLIKENR